MSIEKFEELKSLIDLDDSYLIGYKLYFLEENKENELVPMKAEISSDDNEIENSIINLKKFFKDKSLESYLQETDFSFKETVGFIEEEYLEEFTRIKNVINSREGTHTLSKQNHLDNIKGLLIQLTLKNKKSEIKEVLLYSQITKNHLHKKKPLFPIDFKKEVIMKKIKKPVIDLNLNYCALHYEDKIYILHPHYFEQLFKVYKRFEIATEEVLVILKQMDLISGFSEFEESCRKNINFQRKLFNIKNSRNLTKITFNDYCVINSKVEGALKINFNKDDTISIDQDNKFQSVNQIIRILNNEAAETILNEETIFADRKQRIR